MSTRDQKHGTGAYERSDPALKPIVAFTLGLALLCIAVVFAMRRLYEFLDTRAAAHDAASHPMAERSEPPAPRLQATPSADLAAQRSREDELLSSYDWIDRERGIVRMPIERAIELVAERGLPVRK